MKKSAVIVLAVLFVFGFAAQSAFGTNMTVGVASWLVNWDMVQDSKVDNPFFMIGPAVSIGLGKTTSLSTLVLIGGTKIGAMGNPLDPFTYSPGADIIRLDCDTAVNFKISRYFKLFGGFKLMHYKAKYDGDLGNATATGIGPAGGIAGTLPLGSNFFLLGNVALMYNASFMTMDGGDDNWDHMVGYNGTLSLAYYISAINVAISAGYRVQGFTVSGNNFFNDWELFHGFSLSAVYSFRI